VDEGKQLAKEYGIGFFETSAKNDIEVDTVDLRVFTCLRCGGELVLAVLCSLSACACMCPMTVLCTLLFFLAFLALCALV